MDGERKAGVVPHARTPVRRRLGVAVVGAGYWGPVLLRNFFAAAHWNLKAVCDLDPLRLAKSASVYPGVYQTPAIDGLLADPAIDAIAIATPPETHFALAYAALTAGKHVLVEKPLTTNSDDGRILCELAERLGLTLMVDHTFLFASAVEFLKQYIEDGNLGEIYYVDAVRVNLGLYQKSSSVILDLAPHDISILNYLLAATPLEIATTVAQCVDRDINDVAYLTFRYPGNVLAHAHLSWLSPVKIRRMNIAGRGKMIVWDDLGMDRIKIYDKGVDVTVDDEMKTKNLVTYRTGDMIAPALDNSEAMARVIDEFYRVIVDGAHCRSTGRDGLEVVRILEAAERSVAEGGRSVPVSGAIV